MRRKTIVCVVVVICILMSAGTAFAAPHRGGGHGGFGQVTQVPQTTGRTQCTNPDCPRVTGEGGSCANTNCSYYKNCSNEDCPRLNGGKCTNPDCPFDGERPQDGTGVHAGKQNVSGGNASNSAGTRTGGHHGGRNH